MEPPLRPPGNKPDFFTTGTDVPTYSRPSLSGSSNLSDLCCAALYIAVRTRLSPRRAQTEFSPVRRFSRL